LFNPDTAQRCDCGYDFETKTIRESYDKLPMPKIVTGFVVALLAVDALALAMRVIQLLRGSAADDGTGASDLVIRTAVTVFLLVSSAAVFLMYRQFAQRKQWARFGLVVAGIVNGVAVGGFPMLAIIVSALAAGLSREARMYCLQRATSGQPAS
jgi:hypothetical protein